MKKIRIRYNNETKAVDIISEGNAFNCSKITGMEIDEWCEPFMLRGVEWLGIYEELKNYYNEESFSIVFWGDKNSLEILRKTLAEKNIQVEGLENVVFILYNGNERSTKITVNGNVFDTSRLENRSIDEWIDPFQINNIVWNGIFEELENYIGTDAYSLNLVGKKEDMSCLAEKCPEVVELNFKTPRASSFKSVSPINNYNKPSTENESSSNPMPTTFYSEPPSPQIPPPSIESKSPNLVNYNSNNRFSLFKDGMREFNNLSSEHHGVATYGKIAATISILNCVIALFIHLHFLLFISIILTLIFIVLILTDGYKKLTLTVVCLLLIPEVVELIILINYRITSISKLFE